MNPNMEIEGNPESENQTINEPEYEKVNDSHNPLKRGRQFRFEGVDFEVYDNRNRGRSFVRMLGRKVVANG